MKKSTLMNGLLYGGVSVLIFLLLYFVKPELNFAYSIGLITSLLIPIFFIRKGIIEAREEEEGSISFGESMAVAFPIYLIGSLLVTIANVAVLTMDEDYRVQGETIALEMAEQGIIKGFELFNGPKDQMEQALAELKNNPPKITNSQIMIGFLFSLIFPGIILCLIMSAILKRT